MGPVYGEGYVNRLDNNERRDQDIGHEWCWNFWIIVRVCCMDNYPMYEQLFRKKFIIQPTRKVDSKLPLQLFAYNSVTLKYASDFCS